MKVKIRRYEAFENAEECLESGVWSLEPKPGTGIIESGIRQGQPIDLRSRLQTPDSRPNTTYLRWTALVSVIALSLTISAFASPRKGSASGKSAPADRGSRAPAETVFVPVTPASPQMAARETRSYEPSSRDTDPRRAEPSVSVGPIRDYEQAFGLNVGYYAAEVLGTNPYTDGYWDLYPSGQAYFFEFTAGIGTVQSSFAKSIIGGTQTPHSFMIAGEALGGYSLSGLTHGEGRSGGLFPYFVGGITAVWQGGIPNIGAVLGFGNRMNVPFMAKNGRYALNYGVHDPIYSQKLKIDPSITQNFVLLVGVQKYF